MLRNLYEIFLNCMEGLSICSTQVAAVLILFDDVLAMSLSISTKYEKKKVIATSSLMILLKYSQHFA